MTHQGGQSLRLPLVVGMSWYRSVTLTLGTWQMLLFTPLWFATLPECLVVPLGLGWSVWGISSLAVWLDVWPNRPRDLWIDDQRVRQDWFVDEADSLSVRRNPSWDLISTGQTSLEPLHETIERKCHLEYPLDFHLHPVDKASANVLFDRLYGLALRVRQPILYRKGVSDNTRKRPLFISVSSLTVLASTVMLLPIAYLIWPICGLVFFYLRAHTNYPILLGLLLWVLPIIVVYAIKLILKKLVLARSIEPSFDLNAIRSEETLPDYRTSDLDSHPRCSIQVTNRGDGAL